MEKRISILIYILSFVPICLRAQSLAIKGTILSKENKPIEAANVYIMDMDSTIITGGSTNSMGFFNIELPSKGDYILSANFLGYLKQELFLKGVEKSTNIGKLFLSEANKMLDEVVVTAKSQINQSDKTLLFPTELQKKHSTDGFSLLNNLMIPQLDVDVLKKNVSSKGKPVTLLLNGRPITDNSEITALRPKDIIRIEYHEMPTGAFAEYESVINYITRQYEFGGYIGINGTQQTTYGEGDYLVISRINYKENEHTLGYNLDFLHDDKIHREVSELFTYPNNDVLYRTENSQPSIEKNHTHHIFYNYNFRNKQTQINIKLGYKKYDSDEDFNSLLNYKGTVEQSLKLSNVSSEKQNNPYFSFYTDLKLKKQQSLYIRGSIDYSRNHYKYAYEEEKENSVPSSLYTNATEDYYSTILGAIYTKTFSKGRELSLNLRNYIHISKSIYNNGNDINKEHFTTNESLYSLNLSKKWKKMFLSVRLGMSSLFYFQKDERDKKFWSYRPEMTFRYIFNERSTFQYRGGLNNSFPTLSLFTNTEQNIDFIQKKVGNPSLKIVEIISNQLSYSYTSKQFNLNLFFNYFHSEPNTGKQVIYDGTYFVHSYINNGGYNLINPELGVSVKLWSNLLNFKISGGLYRYIITGDNNIYKNDWYINPSLMVFYKKFNSNLYYYSSRKGVYDSLDQWTSDNRYGLTVSYNTGGLSLGIGTQNPFSTYRRTNKINLNIYSSHSLSNNQQNDHLFYIKVAYNIDFGRKHKYTEINARKGTNSAIMKNTKE
ncbi:carboxypeptidase-like regulatory domain-containing protein [uncultured Bacteroides sp.]|uniref:carboxypeptidase-like regulatory domain-containing protein n=1 Tax=uncultured Bacteroides sp. TaxID=162156 RepID=UPI002AA73FA8|nr:carboxypeptidase-like regulatory domain-containing protein [uncultured Bacteroides sp.]